MAYISWVSLGHPSLGEHELAKLLTESLLPLPAEATTSRKMRAFWEESLLGNGWIKGLKVGKSRLSIGYVFMETGLCIQLGNTSRVYADLLKLETLYRLKQISQAVLVVPSDEYSQSLGTNYASFSRAEQDIKALNPTITVPILLISIDNRRGK